MDKYVHKPARLSHFVTITIILSFNEFRPSILILITIRTRTFLFVFIPIKRAMEINYHCYNIK